MVPVGIDLALFEMRLAGLEEELERRKKLGVVGGGTWQTADFWLVALRGAELKSSKVEGGRGRTDRTKTQARFLASLGMTEGGARRG